MSELANKIKEKTIKDQKLKKNAYALEYAVRAAELSFNLLVTKLSSRDLYITFQPPYFLHTSYLVLLNIYW